MKKDTGKRKTALRAVNSLLRIQNDSPAPSIRPPANCLGGIHFRREN
jgi:hypothetical protein